MEQQPVNITPQMLAPFYKRLLTLIADLIIIVIIFMVLVQVCNNAADVYGYQFLKIGKLEMGVQNTRVSMLSFLVSLTYYGMFESYLQRTPGKFIAGTRVIRFDGTKPTEWNILFRSLLRQIPLEAISFIGPLPVGLHDSLSKTLVIDIYKYEREQQKQQYKNTNSASGI
jgi:uncharacterized RDD family membrane protein YckC